MTDYGVVLFHTTSAALRAERLAKQAGLTYKLIPVPRQLSSDCGISLRFEWQQLTDIEAMLAAGHVDSAGIHRLEATRRRRTR
jgi:hypothetical protein